MPPKGIFDKYTRVDDLLIENTAAINRLADILQLKEDVVEKPLFFTYPSSGSALVTIEEGTTVLNFEVGTITDINDLILAEQELNYGLNQKRFISRSLRHLIKVYLKQTKTKENTQWNTQSN